MNSTPIISELERILPLAKIAGYSFASRLPHPSTVPPARRIALVEEYKKETKQRCLEEISLAYKFKKIPERKNSGEMDWPHGYTGSISHKGTIVVVACAEEANYSMLGVDIERESAANCQLQESVISPEGLPLLEKNLAKALCLSMKESFYKAQFPRTQLKLDYSDVEIEWNVADKSCICELKNQSRELKLTGKWTTSDRWIATTAYSLNALQKQ